MPSSWPVEALRAQAIAARSYAAYRLRPGIGTFDAYDDTRSQVYLGVRRETAATDAVVAATANQVLRSGTAIANAVFHSTGGGATENNEYAFVTSSGAVTSGRVSYLRGSPDRDANGVAYDAASPYASWQTKAYTLSALSAMLAIDTRTDVGSLTGLGLANRGVSGRLISVTLFGSKGTKTVSGNVLIAVVNARNPVGDPDIRSTLFDIVPLR
jgi:stage II sporulation protein D